MDATKRASRRHKQAVDMIEEVGEAEEKLPPIDVFEIWPLLGAVDTVPYVCE